MTSDAPAPRRRRLVSWLASLVAGALFLWLASTQLRLWPDALSLPRPDLLAWAVAAHVPYAVLRAMRLTYLLDPVVVAATGDANRRMDRAAVYGSGLLSFFVLMVLPLKLGELSRPLLLVRAQQPGVQLTESLAAVATERILDGLLICAMLFGGLALASGYAPGVADNLGNVQRFGQAMAALFSVALVGLLIAARFPEQSAALLRRYGGGLGPRAARLSLRLTAPVAALFDLRRAVPLVVTSLLYWGVTTAQLWLVLAACGVPLGAPEAAAVVAIIGLSIQLPGGPAQTGTFQVGAAAALGLFLTDAQVAGAGSSFAVMMYLLQFGGAAFMAIPGAWLVGRATAGAADRSEPAPPA